MHKQSTLLVRKKVWDYLKEGENRLLSIWKEVPCFTESDASASGVGIPHMETQNQEHPDQMEIWDREQR